MQEKAMPGEIRQAALDACQRAQKPEGAFAPGGHYAVTRVEEARPAFLRLLAPDGTQEGWLVEVEYIQTFPFWGKVWWELVVHLPDSYHVVQERHRPPTLAQERETLQGMRAVLEQVRDENVRAFLLQYVPGDPIGREQDFKAVAGKLRVVADTFGSEHPWLLLCLAQLDLAQGEFLQAESACARAVAHRIQVQEGPDRILFSQGVQGVYAAMLAFTDEERKWLEGKVEDVVDYTHLPYHRNHFFTGRGEIMEQLKAWSETWLADLRAAEILALVGPAGCGKTDIAVEYANRYYRKHRALLLVRASSPQQMSADLAAILSHLGVPVAKAKATDPRSLFDALESWLNTHTGWLLILDGIEDEQVHWTTSGIMSRHGQVLLTSRCKLGGYISTCPVGPLDVEEGAGFLLRRGKEIGFGEALEQAPADLVVGAREVVVMLEGHALALEQAAAYLEETGASPQEYLEVFSRHCRDLLDRRGMHLDDDSGSVLARFEHCLEQVQSGDAAAADLLRVLLFLPAGHIPEEIVTAGGAGLSRHLQSLVSNPLKLDRAMFQLMNVSLVRRNPDRKTVELMPLVRTALRCAMKASDQRKWAEQAVQAVAQAWSTGGSSPQGAERLRPAVAYCLEQALTFRLRGRSVELLQRVVGEGTLPEVL